MRVGVVDVGGNTARLLVAECDGPELVRVARDRFVLGLGGEIERRGSISRGKLAETRAVVGKLVRSAWRGGCDDIAVFVTSPGRQAGNRDALGDALARVAPGRIRFVSAAEEARLAFAGAVAAVDVRGPMAVCDVGGGSTELALGSGADTFWLRSADLGSLRVTRRYLADPATKRKDGLAAARTAIREHLSEVAPQILPPRLTALATGGTARALGKLVGERLGADELGAALDLVLRTKPRKLAERFEVPQWRAPLLAGGALLLAEVQRRLDVPLQVSAQGFREGAARELVAEQAAAA
jgi:exopolyphosphatase / guanosine-5'-triphosphate,3'-diphosphate pyrophosphatase